MMRSIITASVALVLAGCGTTTYVATPTQFKNPKAPASCSYDAPDKLPDLTVPPGEITLLQLAASNAVAHRTANSIYRDVRQALKICGAYARRVSS